MAYKVLLSFKSADKILWYCYFSVTVFLNDYGRCRTSIIELVLENSRFCCQRYSAKNDIEHVCFLETTVFVSACYVRRSSLVEFPAIK